MVKKDGSALGFLSFLAGNLVKSMRQEPIGKQNPIVGKNHIKNLGDELAIVACLAAHLIIITICIVTLLLSTRDEEEKIYPQKR